MSPDRCEEMHVEAEVVADYACRTGEGPLWHPDERRLYWVDIPTGRMFRYAPATGEHEQCYGGPPVGGFTIQRDGTLLLFMAGGAVAAWHDGELQYVIEEIPEERESRFNDVIADPAGRVFCGTMPTPDQGGRLYRLDTDGSVTKLLEGVACSNGMGFTPDLRGMYYTDSGPREICLFDYDAESGTLANRRLFVRTPEGEGVPDGLTVDAEGGVWSARWGGGCVVRYAPDGSEERRVRLPVPKVSCPTFGGEDYAEMYVTSAGGDRKDGEGEHAGALFRLRTGVRGVPEHRSAVGLD
ncbi:MAG: SMP-30/gluconolactonase/LRE family protein [Candidatus Brocadiaceae bacterium]|jgi:D-xylonolactonase